MPPIRIERVVSVSSEDPAFPAQHLLKTDYDFGKRWKCKTPGEKQCSAIFQLQKSFKITSIDVGNYYSAFIEILVAKSSATDDFKVLLGASALMSLRDAKYRENGECTRFFKVEHLTKPAADEKWDRVKVICSQPYNNHTQYGLSFVIFHGIKDEEPTQGPTPTPIPTPALASGELGRFKLKQEIPDVPLNPGSIFARRKEFAEQDLKGAAAIRAASLPQNVDKPTSSKAKVTTPNIRKGPGVSKINPLTPKIDAQTPKQTNNTHTDTAVSAQATNGHVSTDSDSKTPGRNGDRKRKPEDRKTPNRKNGPVGAKKNTNAKSPVKKPRRKGPEKPFNKLMENVAFVISGFQNPLRGEIRNKGLAMGAKYKGDWDNTCTHLICAFANTPKYNQVRGQGKIVSKEWIEDAYSRRIRYPWRRFALDRNDRVQDESEVEIYEKEEKAGGKVKKAGPSVNDHRKRLISTESESGDTEDEIEKVRLKQKKNDSTASTSKVSNDPPPISIYDMETDGEEDDNETKDIPKASGGGDPLPPLSDIFTSTTFHVSSSLEDAERKMLKRYIIAHKGTVVDAISNEIEYVIANDNEDLVSLKGEFPELVFVKAEWILRSHDENKVLPSSTYEL